MLSVMTFSEILIMKLALDKQLALDKLFTTYLILFS